MKSVLSRMSRKNTATQSVVEPQNGGAPAPVTRPRLLYIDHIFHIKTRSTIFVADILGAHFDLHTVYIDPDKKVDLPLLQDPAEYVVIFQMDFLTPAFVAAGKRVTVIQMFDGSGGLPDNYFHLNRQARHLNFSATLHARALENGVSSHLVQYFPDPADVIPVADFDTLRGFFWQRVPGSNINLGAVKTMLGDQLDTLHVHTPTDHGTPFDPVALEGFTCEVTTSDWFEDHSAFAAVMDRCNVFIAPRNAEGIGHAFLEAMARGMVVLAYDGPTHNEYIADGDTGLLFSDTSQQIPLKEMPDKLEEVSQHARLAIANGHANWCEDRQGIVDFVRGAQPAQVPPLPQLDTFVTGCIEAYQQGIPSYISFLDTHPELVRALGKWDLLGAELDALTPRGSGADAAGKATFFFGYNGAHMILDQGWSVSEASHIWAIARQASLHIPLGGPMALEHITIEVRGLDSYDLEVEVNGVAVGTVSMLPVLTSFTLPLPEAVFENHDSNLSIVLRVPEEAVVPRVEDRPLSFAIKTLALGPMKNSRAA